MANFDLPEDLRTPHGGRTSISAAGTDAAFTRYSPSPYHAGGGEIITPMPNGRPIRIPIMKHYQEIQSAGCPPVETETLYGTANPGKFAGGKDLSAYPTHGPRANLSLPNAATIPPAFPMASHATIISQFPHGVYHSRTEEGYRDKWRMVRR